MLLQKKLNTILLIVLCVLPLIIIPYIKDYFYLPKIYLLYFLLLFAAGQCFINNDNPLSISYFSIKALFIYLLSLIISTFFSMDILCSIWGNPTREEGLLAISAYMFLFILANKYYIFNYKHVKLLMLSACIIAIYGITQYFGYDPIPRDVFRVNWKNVAFSTIGNRNFLGSYIVLILPISIYSYIFSRKTIFLTASYILFLCLLCTRTRGAWLGGFISLAFLTYYIITQKLSLKHYLYILIGFALITIFFNIISDNGLFDRFLSIFKETQAVISQSENYETAGANRFFIWERVVKLISKHPIFGVGLENLDIAFANDYASETLKITNGVYNTYDKAHNEYLHIAVTTGIPSLILYLTFILSVVYKGFKNAKKDHLIIPVLCSVIGYMTQAFFNVSVVSVAFIYWTFLGILLNLSSVKVTNEVKSSNLSVNEPVQEETNLIISK